MLRWMLLLLVSSSGCSALNSFRHVPSNSAGLAKAAPIPREKEMGILPEYRIAPPDVLNITGIRLSPKTPYVLKIGDELVLDVVGTVPDAPISGIYPVGIGGEINLGFSYGRVRVADKTVEDAQEAIREHLLQHLRDPIVTATLGRIGGVQQIVGQRLVAQDGRVNLGTYGTVPVTGLTITEAKDRIEEHLSQFLEDPEVAVDVQNYNSTFYYVIQQGAGLGDQVTRVPVTGNETVLDALTVLGGFNRQLSQQVWIARPGRNRKGEEQILHVDYRAIAQLGETDTNYQLLPGDRLYISEDRMVRLDNELRTLTRPAFTLGQFLNFSIGTVRNFSGNVLGQSNAGFNFGGGVGNIPGGGAGVGGFNTGF